MVEAHDLDQTDLAGTGDVRPAAGIHVQVGDLHDAHRTLHSRWTPQGQSRQLVGADEVHSDRTVLPDHPVGQFLGGEHRCRL